jgi:hypothetical protein
MPMPALAPEVSFRRVRCFDVGFVRCMKEGIVDVVDGGKMPCREDQRLIGRVGVRREWREWRKKREGLMRWYVDE